MQLFQNTFKVVSCLKWCCIIIHVITGYAIISTQGQGRLNSGEILEEPVSLVSPICLTLVKVLQLEIR